MKFDGVPDGYNDCLNKRTFAACHESTRRLSSRSPESPIWIILNEVDYFPIKGARLPDPR
jgi:hypothetical protein